MPRAAPLLKRSLAVREKVLGSDHSDLYPWLGSELNVAIGRHQGDPHMPLTPVKIAVLDGDLVVTLPEGSRERIVREKVGVDQVVGAR